MAIYYIQVELDVPLQGPFVYVWQGNRPCKGLRVLVPFGARELVGLIVDVLTPEALDRLTQQVPSEHIKTALDVFFDLPPLPDDWFALGRFASEYYHRPLGEVLLPAIPQGLKRAQAYTGKLAKGGPVARLDAKRQKVSVNLVESVKAHEPTVEQAQAISKISTLDGYKAVLLHGVTGSGKTEVYLQVAEKVLKQGKQVLFLVPEINLTPQFEKLLKARFEHYLGPHGIAVLHSGLADGARVKAWVDMQRNEAKLVLGTRLAIFSPLANLGLIIIDEEHDFSYKQQEGLRYSARDLAIWRAHQLNIPIILGSATPSLETWHHAKIGKYLKLELTSRAMSTHLPKIQLVDTRHLQLQEGFSPRVLAQLKDRVNQGEQGMVYLNRRGYAPVLQCLACGWVSQCPSCSVYTVLHQSSGNGYRMNCHHCGYQSKAPRACPDCGNQDLQGIGRGTQRIEEFLESEFGEHRVLRIDADSTRRKGSAERLFNEVHAGNIDVFVGTQMVAKGHDFKALGLVVILGADNMLFSSDFRAPERLFSQLMQVAGRAGRHKSGAEVLIQTNHPDHPLYQALLNHDFEAFADGLLKDRELAGLPPFSYQCLLTAQSKQVQQALAFLQQARQEAQDWIATNHYRNLLVYDPVPLRIVRVANIERAQILLESASRTALQRLLSDWLPKLPAFAKIHKVKHFVEVDPLSI